MQIGVLGAGLMGHGIAQVSALGGHDVVVRDVERDLVDDGLASIEGNLSDGVERGKVTEDEMDAALDRIEGTTSLEEACTDADLVIEAVPEEIEIKKDVFSSVEEHVSSDAVIATNTSSLSVTEIASALEEPGRAVGLHFFNPAHIMPLVEIVVAEQTTAETEAFAEEYVDDVDKTDARIVDFPGFASSRLGALISAEAVRMVEQGVATPEDIDTVMRLGYNYPMGPIEVLDHTGVDTNLHVLEYLREELGERFKPPQLLKRKARAGKLGRKTGEGFYVWEDGEPVRMSDDYGEES